MKIKFISLLLVLFLANQTNATITSPGQMCQPANLNQALKFGLGWSQFGVTNDSPIGGGSFFVVCPLVLDAAEQNFTTFSIEVQYLSPAANSITCTVYQVDAGNGATIVENVQAVPAATISNPGSGSYPLGRSTSFTPTGFSYTGGDEALNVVCAMHPKTRIGHFGADG